MGDSYGDPDGTSRWLGLADADVEKKAEGGQARWHRAAIYAPRLARMRSRALPSRSHEPPCVGAQTCLGAALPDRA